MSPRSLAKRCTLALAGALILYSACETPEHKEERIARMYCGYCHAFPHPELLDRSTWEKSVLPLMAFHMGSTDTDIVGTINPADLDYVLASLPARPMASEEDWKLITDYYLSRAPDSLAVEHPPITDTLTSFRPHPLRNSFEPYVTLLSYDTGRKELYAGTRLMKLFTFGASLRPVDSVRLESPPSWMIRTDEGLSVTAMGIMDPNDRPEGQVLRITDDTKILTVIDSIKRPVFFEQRDLNGDRLDDYVVCAFGNYTGNLSVYESKDGAWIEHTLATTPGARKTITRDFDHDGRPDIMALFAQGDERIVLYRNNGDFTFDDRTLLRFSPVDGTSYFEVADMNGDGHPDILVTNGDNADYSMIVKPYHGVTIYENDGENNFFRKWSYPMAGASMALARDFDNDGDADIAAISFFPDFKKAPDRGFLYFENTGGYHFIARKASYSTLARWLVMEAADYDADGDLDIVLGANNFRGLGAGPEQYNEWMRHKTPVLFLENRLDSQP
jgi:hypothetical protein